MCEQRCSYMLSCVVCFQISGKSLLMCNQYIVFCIVRVELRNWLLFYCKLYVNNYSVTRYYDLFVTKKFKLIAFEKVREVSQAIYLSCTRMHSRYSHRTDTYIAFCSKFLLPTHETAISKKTDR